MTALNLYSRWLAAPALLMAAAFVTAAPVTNPPSGDSKKDETPAEKVRKALDQPTDIEIVNQPLATAILQLGEQTKVNFVIDSLTIQNQLGIDLQGAAVNVKLTGVKLRSILRTMLSQHNLSYAVLGDTVLITTEDLATQRQMRQRVSVEVEKQTLAQALKQLGRDTGTNLIVDTRVAKEAQGQVSLQLDDVPLETAVRLLGAMTGLKTVRVGNVLFVTNKETANEMRQDGDVVAPAPAVNPDIGILRGQLQMGGLGGGFAIPPQLLLQQAQPAFIPGVQPVPPVVVPEAPPKPNDLPPPPPEDKPKR